MISWLREKFVPPVALGPFIGFDLLPQWRFGWEITDDAVLHPTLVNWVWFSIGPLDLNFRRAAA